MWYIVAITLGLIPRTMDKQHFALDRKHDRISTEIRCRLGLVGEQEYQGTVINLSAGGLRLACNLATYEAIIPEEQRTPGQVIDVHIDIKFTLQPDNQPPVDLQLRAMVIHSERLAQDNFHIGIQFEGMDKSDFNRLEEYVETVLAANAG